MSTLNALCFCTILYFYSKMYRNDDKYHHGAFSGPNKHRLESLKNIIAVIGNWIISFIFSKNL